MAALRCLLHGFAFWVLELHNSSVLTVAESGPASTEIDFGTRAWSRNLKEGVYYPATSLYTRQSQELPASVSLNFGPQFAYPIPEVEGCPPPAPASVLAGSPEDPIPETVPEGAPRLAFIPPVFKRMQRLCARGELCGSASFDVRANSIIKLACRLSWAFATESFLLPPLSMFFPPLIGGNPEAPHACFGSVTLVSATAQFMQDWRSDA